LTIEQELVRRLQFSPRVSELTSHFDPESTIINRQSQMAMPVGVLTLEIQIPWAHSLKEKRAILQKMRDRLRGRFNVAVAELDHQDLWQQATLGVAAISSSRPLLEQVLRRALAEAEKTLGDDVQDYNIEIF
jgi:uncharacterized protein